MTLVKRLEKGSALTYSEMDGNLDHLSDHNNLTNRLIESAHSQYALSSSLINYSLTTHTHNNLVSLSSASITSDVIVVTSIRGKTGGRIYFDSDGYVGMGTAVDPIYNLHVSNTGVVRNYIESTDGVQASTDLRSGIKHSRMITDQNFI